MKFTESGQPGDEIERQILRAVCADIITDIQKFLDIGLLSGIRCGEMSGALCIIAPDQYQHGEKPAVYGYLRKRCVCQIFILDLQEERAEERMYIWVFFRRDNDHGRKKRQDGLYFPDASQHRSIRLEKDTLSALLGGIQCVQTTGTDQHDILFPQDGGPVTAVNEQT